MDSGEIGDHNTIDGAIFSAFTAIYALTIIDIGEVIRNRNCANGAALFAFFTAEAAMFTFYANDSALFLITTCNEHLINVIHERDNMLRASFSTQTTACTQFCINVSDTVFDTYSA